ncbi:ATP-binding cassette domain-containing protein [Stutzerimonas degradans]|uniref:ATP-binding cassette domain-containing protein n=1 Tax=Stutzerimonas degradans TaxID=2968968 RepID=UPI003704874B
MDIQQLNFTYPGLDTPSLRGINLRIAPGERVAIIGRSGSGKSTLARLIMGLHTPTEGQILLDGLDLRQIDVADLRSQIGYVSHDMPLLAGSLRDNLTLGAHYVSDERMLEVAQLTGAHELARQHPLGFDRPVGERGQLLSGGQRQMVLMARALLLDPPILLFDEPTSALDNSTEDTLRQHLKAWANGKTLLLITHRMSMLSLVERLVVLDHGRVVADGPKAAVIEALRKGHIGQASV